MLQMKNIHIFFTATNFYAVDNPGKWMGIYYSFFLTVSQYFSKQKCTMSLVGIDHEYICPHNIIITELILQGKYHCNSKEQLSCFSLGWNLLSNWVDVKRKEDGPTKQLFSNANTKNVQS